MSRMERLVRLRKAEREKAAREVARIQAQIDKMQEQIRGLRAEVMTSDGAGTLPSAVFQMCDFAARQAAESLARYQSEHVAAMAHLQACTVEEKRMQALADREAERKAKEVARLEQEEMDDWALSRGEQQ